MMIRTLAATLLLTATAAHAVPYTLPSSAERPYAQLQSADGSMMLCATWVRSGECDVAPGNYRLVTYTPDWTGQSSSVTIGESSSGITLSEAFEICDQAEPDTIVTIDEQSTAQCTASCPAGTVPISTSCTVTDARTFQPTLIEFGGGSCLWANPNSEIYFAGAVCASSDLFQ